MRTDRVLLAVAASFLLPSVTACGSTSSGDSADASASGDGGGAPADTKDSSAGPAGEAGDSGSAPVDSASGSPGGDSGSGADGGTAGDSGTPLPSGRSFPDTWGTVAILADQFPSGLSAAQQRFVATHFVGTEKQVLSDTRALRAINPNFLVLHYHLAMWQSAPSVSFIIDGQTWGNDYPTVTADESWFWHNASNGRVTAPDGKFLMNVSVKAFSDYWASSLATQVADGEYDGIMFDSAAPNLLQGWCGGSGANQDSRLAGTAAKDTAFAELGSTTWIAAWQTWIGALDATLAAKGIPLIPNDGSFVTSWDTTNYALTAGVFSEGFADPTFAESDWKAATTELLSLSAAGKILILQNYLASANDTKTRLYYLANYLLVKGHATYLDYFAGGPLEWYPEWTVDLGAPTGPVVTDVSALASGGVYRRDFAKGSVLVNPATSTVNVDLGATLNLVAPSGGGAIDASGNVAGSVMTSPVTSVALAPTSAAIVLR